MQYTVNQLAKLSGVSRRTLHFYDELGLHKASCTGTNQYRYAPAQRGFTENCERSIMKKSAGGGALERLHC